MYPLDEKNLDRLSAEAAEHYHAPGNPSWESVEKVLDIELPQKKEKKRRTLFFFFLLAGLFISGAAWWHYRQPVPASVIANTTSNNTAPVVATGTDHTTTASTTPANTGNSNNTISTATAKPVPLSNARPGAMPVNANDNTITKITDKKAFNPANQPAGIRNNNLPAMNAVPQAVKNAIISGNAPLASAKKTTSHTGKGQPVIAPGHTVTANETGSNSNTSEIANNEKANEKVNPPVTTAAVITPAQDKAIATKTDSATVIQTPAATPPVKPETAKGDDKKKKSPVTGKAFSIGVTAGTDISTVSFTYGNNAGYNIGLLAGYHFNKNVSVYTGAIYTKKNYKLEGYQYHPPYWNSTYDLQTVDGYCRMWELPVLGRYTFNSKTSTRLFVTAGMSSYFMTQEHYNFNYKVGAVPGSRAWTNDVSSNYWFSILDISAGVEKQLGPHLVGQVEPYAKLPFAGLGYGKIQLSSFGVNVTLQYRGKIGK